MKFIVDAQLPPVLAEWIAGRRHAAQHVFNLHLLDTSDAAIWDLALETGTIVVTKDYDFVEWATSRQPAPQVLWIRVGNATNPSLMARLDAAWEQIVSDLEAGAQVVEVG